MEVRPWYQRTEVGVIPMEWDVVPIGEIVTDFHGGAPLKPNDFTASGIKVLPKGGVGRTGWLKIAERDQHFCSPSYAAAHRNNQVDQSYTIVVLRDLVPSGPSIGLIVRIKEAETYVLAQGVYGFKVNSQADPRYLVQLSNTHWYRQLMNSIMVGSTQVHVTNTAFKRARIPLPKAVEQRGIATALSDMDALAGALEGLIAKKRDLKQAALHQLLTGQTRLPGFSGVWHPKRLRDDVILLSGHHILAQFCNTRSQGTPYLTGPADFPQSRITVTKFTDHPGTMCAQNDILVTVKGSGSGTIVLADREYCISRQLMAIRVQKWNHGFVYYSLLQNAEQFAAASAGLIPGLSRSDILDQAIPLPPDEAEQEAIADALADMDAEIGALEQRLTKTRDLKQAMMQELLTGRIRLAPPGARNG